MSFGGRFSNPSGELVIADDALLPIYLGRATLQGTSQPLAIGNAATGTGTGGSSVLTFDYAGQIIPVLAMPAGRRGAIISCTQAGTTWSIRVSFSDGTGITDINSPAVGMLTQLAPTVFVFGFAASAGSGYGMQLFNASGQLTVDLTRRPLMIAQRVSVPANVSSVSMAAAMTLPGILGRATDARVTGGPTGVPETQRQAQSFSIFSISGTTFTRSFERRRLRTTTIDDPEIPGRLDQCNLWLVECSGLP